MALYLHLYNTQADFERVYNTDTPAPEYFDCPLGRYSFLENPFPGGFSWHTEDEEAPLLYTMTRAPKVGLWTGEDLPEDPEEFLGAFIWDDDTYTFIEITAVEDVSSKVYHEPWVSYTKESATTEVVTGFTCSTSPHSSLTGTFTFVGEFYFSVTVEVEPGDWRDVYDIASAISHVPVWTNGTVYVAPSYRNMSRDITTDTYLNKVYMADGHPGFLENMTSNLGQCIQQTLKGEEKLKQTNYNKGKNRIYLTWDGVSTTTVGSGSSAKQYPTYVVNQEKSRGGLEMARVYVNGEYAFSLENFNNVHMLDASGLVEYSIAFNKNSEGEITYHYRFQAGLI